MSVTEEAAWLVGRSDSEGSKSGFGTMAYTEDRLTGGEPICEMGAGEVGPGEVGSPPADADRGELLDPTDVSALDHFHDDALRQAGCGLSQARIVLACGLAVAGATLELSAIPFILPSAEIELCILPHEKNWLVLISLMGSACGCVWWGAVCGRLGARRALLSALAVNAVFASVAAFMPTYGTFMMARFCSALGSGGIIPTTFTYTAEVCIRMCRHKALATLVMASAAGALASAALAQAVLPLTGPLTLLEDKEHFSAWHRYLLLCTLPILASLIALIWTPESPRFLLEAGREVEAMTVYQDIHSGNQIKCCGGGAGGAGGNAYRVGELALPAKRRPHTNCPQNTHIFCFSILQIFSATYRRTTLCLGGILLFTMTIQFYLSTYVPATVWDMDRSMFSMSQRSVKNARQNSEHYNVTLENIHYTNVTFNNCTYRDMLLSHVAFKNCSFYDVAFLNIKTSYTVFEGCLFVNSTIIDTDIEMGRQLDPNCVLNNTVIRGMRPTCSLADLTSTLAHRTREQNYVSYAILVAGVLALLPMRFRPLVILCAICLLLTPAVYISQSETALYVTEAVYRVFLTLIFYTVGCSIVDNYPTGLRSICHGLCLCISYGVSAAAVAGGGAGGGGVLGASLLTAALAAAAVATAAVIR